jgi:hypothetical protein
MSVKTARKNEVRLQLGTLHRLLRYALKVDETNSNSKDIADLMKANHGFVLSLLNMVNYHFSNVHETFAVWSGTEKKETFDVGCFLLNTLLARARRNAPLNNDVNGSISRMPD